MEFSIHAVPSGAIAELTGREMILISVEDMVDLIGNADYRGARRVIIYQGQLHPDFFRLSTGLAGEMLQKVSTYRMQLAIVGNFRELSSRSLRDFIRESNRQGRVFFVNDKQEALSCLSGR